ncbi:MAG TPA: transcriptional repressor [Candidatus Binatia bacterium]|jgi:Fe2+ or Zn2+ uptake regulation protein|nr:transcriptional repressor [Candidatus Binatia bacterium]
MASRPRGARRGTRQRALVLAAVRASGVEHPTADRVFARVRADLPRVSLGTVYRNLQRLVAEGAIGVAQIADRAARYDPTPTPHDHFVCDRCGRVDDLATEDASARVAAALRAGHAVRAHALIVYGDCRRCRGEERPA